jgi:glycosyltransferase involved in cell wall biosynthesis
MEKIISYRMSPNLSPENSCTNFHSSPETLRCVSGSPLRVLHFVPRVPWPLNTGAKLRNYHLARQLARRTQISLLAFSDQALETSHDSTQLSISEHSKSMQHGAERGPAESFLACPERFYTRETIVDRDQSYTPAKIVRGAVGRTPLPLLNYTTSAMKRALERILRKDDFDVVQIESIHLLAYLPIIRAAASRPLVILDWHNIESDLMHQYSERAIGTLRRAYARRTSAQLSRLERRALKEFDAHVVVSESDRAKLLDYTGDARIFVIENGVDTDYYSDERIESAHAGWLAQKLAAGAGSLDLRSESGSGLRSRAVFVASMDYHANSDAAVSFAREVWPGLHEQRPDLVFTIVGRDPTPEVRQLAMLPGVEVTGTVDDVRPYYREALAAIIPLRVGGGSRLKILEAMASGVPVVSTTLGAEGLEVRDEKDILVANTNQELTDAIIALTDDGERRQKLIAGGRALVLARYDWSRLGEILLETYQNLAATKLTPSTT